tara:strand:+ start:598 stop:825 length:228 start_codon:yes stop_codon:yes gene_type:complete
MTEEDTKALKGLLTAEMVSRVTLAESINIIHNIALGEVDKNLEAMSDEEKKAALEELVDKTQADNSQKTKGQVAK